MAWALSFSASWVNSSLMAKVPMITGIRSIPAARSPMPTLTRATGAMASSPTVASISPRQAAIAARRTLPRWAMTMTISANRISAHLPVVCTSSDRSAIKGASSTSSTAPNTPPIIEAKEAWPSARGPSPRCCIG